MNVYGEKPEEVRGCAEEMIREHNLFQGVKRLGIAVSGGADSLALLLLLAPFCASAGIECVVLTMSHGRAGEEDGIVFVRKIAERFGLPFFSRTTDISGDVAEGRSFEIAARNARMDFFSEISEARKLNAIATGHQADDVAETLFLRLFRGAGVSGLAGLRPRSENGKVLIIRPLLSLSHQALCAWLKKQGQPWREDPDNEVSAARRNQLRHEVFPFLESRCDASLRSHLCRTANLLREEDALMDGLAEKSAFLLTYGSPLSGASLPIPGLLSLELALRRRVLRRWLFENGLEKTSGWISTDRILSLCGEKQEWTAAVSSNVRLVCREGNLSREVISVPSDIPPPVVLAVPGETRWGEWRLTVTPCESINVRSYGVGVSGAVATCSASVLFSKTIFVRSRLSGDRIAPIGMEGTKKIQDVMVDEKVPQIRRDVIPLLVCDEEVVWIPGYRISSRYAVSEGETHMFCLLAECV